ncbi:MAG: fatty acid desaturase [Sandaracinaceae bacterium]|nr:fatty acid desaturase [Sandaracinaceae bacterium]
MLRYTADLRTLAFVGTYYVLVSLAIFSPWLGMTAPWWAMAGHAIVLCFLSFFCAVITHNTVHSPVFKNRTMNRLFQVALTPCYGHPVSAYVPGHNLSHHKFTQTPKDRMRTDKLRFRWNLMNQLMFMPVVGPAIFRDNAEFVKLMKVKNPAWYRQFQMELAFYVFFLVTTFVGFSLVNGLVDALWKWVIFVVLPHQYAAWGIMGINFVQHDGTDPEHKYNHSRNFTGVLVNWFTFNNGYHGIHHEHAGLHWSLAPEVHAKEYAPHIDPRLDQKSLIAYAFKQFIFPGKRVRYDGKPVVLGPPRQDEPWVPSLEKNEPIGDEADYGAAA